MYVSSGVQEVTPFASPSTVFHGNITILPDGQISTFGTGSSPLTQSGNYYNFTGNVNGTLTVEKSGANVNGDGFYLYNNSYSMGPLLNVSGSDNVVVSNLHLTSNSTGGVLVSNASHVNLDRLNISTTELGIFVMTNTFYVNVSNSVVALTNVTLNYFDIGVGLSYGFILPEPTSLSGNNILYNDTVNATGADFGVMIGSNDTKVLDTTVNTDGSLAAVVDSANNSVLNGLQINATAQFAIYVADIFGGSLVNNTLSGSTVEMWNPIPNNNQMYGVGLNTTGTMSGNTISVNNAGGDQGAIVLMGNDTTVSDNVISLGNISTLYNSTGIASTGNNSVIDGNTFDVSGGNTTAIEEASSNYGPLSIDHNVIFANGTRSVTGIMLNGPAQNVNGNSIQIYSGTNTTGIMGAFTGPVYPSGLSVSDNTVAIYNGTGSGINLTSNQSLNNAAISENSLTFGKFTNSNGLQASNLTDSAVSDNVINFQEYSNVYGLVLYNSTNMTVSGNYVSSNGSFSNGITLLGTGNTAIAENIVSGFFNSIYANVASNLTIFGNAVNDSATAVLFDFSNTVTMYHNDIYNYTVPVGAFSSTNIVLNESYPIGGNFYGNLATVDLYSGPGQTSPGSDGMNDTSYVISSGLTDYFPLVKPWTNPQATFTESGLLSGSSWSVTFNGHTETSQSNVITFDIVNGTYQNYTYTVHSSAGYSGGGENGVFAYTGNNSFSMKTSFTPQYVFNITETGIPSGSSWNVSINGTMHSLTSTSYSIMVLNGTVINYRAYNTTLYYGTQLSGTATLSGHNVTVNIQYTHWAYIFGNFTQSGINVSINGENVASGTHSFNESVPAGTYNVVISGKGYVTEYVNFTLNGGQAKNISATLKTVSSGGIPNLYLYVGGGAAAAVIVIAGVYYLVLRKKQ